MTMEKAKVLCVDDEPHVLEGLSLTLRREYDVLTATGGEKGLKAIEQHGPFAVVLSDMLMPGMNGAVFLAEVRRQAPNTTRMLLTGQTGIQAAIAAINEGQIFRFLTKPCPRDMLREAFAAATEQHRLVTAERVLLEQTLHGSVKTLTDILSLTNPVAFGRATRIKRTVTELADRMDLEDRWLVEVAAMLSQLGSITLPEQTAEKFYFGQELSAEERDMVARIPEVTEQLLANIPRLEPVRDILVGQSARFKENGEAGPDGEGIPRGARILKIAGDFDELESKGFSAELALETMCGREGRYDPEILDLFVMMRGAGADQTEVKEIPLQAVRVGMVFAEDVRTETGVLLVTRGYEVTPGFMQRVKNFPRGRVKEPLRIVAERRREAEVTR